MEPNKQKVIELSASKTPDMDWGNKHDPNALLHLVVEKSGPRVVTVDLSQPEQAAARYITAMSRPDVVLHLTPTALWRANRT